MGRCCKGYWRSDGCKSTAHGPRSRTLTKVREAIKRIEEDGWYLVTQRRSHRQYKHPTKPGRVTIAGLPSKDLHPKTYRSILSQAGLEDA